jgi:hypothetical protein
MSDGGFMRHPLAAPTCATVIEGMFDSLTEGHLRDV